MRTILSPRRGSTVPRSLTPGLRPGLHSAAASRLKSGSTFHRGSQIRVLTQTLSPWDFRPWKGVVFGLENAATDGRSSTRTLIRVLTQTL
ncbi:MAG: hypothetical protein ACRD2U_12480 [Terriglobales bacterium]